MADYFSISAYHRIPKPEETLALVARYQAGDKDVFDEILATHERMVYKSALKYYKSGACGDLDLDDILQCGRLGLLRALETFDPSLGYRFSTYAVWWIDQRIRRTGIDEGFAIRYPQHVHDKRSRVNRRAAQISVTGKTANKSQIADEIGVDKIYINGLKYYLRSLDAELRGNPNVTFGETLEDKDASTTERAERDLEIERMYSYIAQLPQKTQLILSMYYGLNGQECLTHRKIAERLGVSRARVEQVVGAAIKTLRQKMTRTPSIHSR